MPAHTTFYPRARALAFAAGLLVAIAAVLGSRLPPAGGSVGVDLTVVASAPRPLLLSPPGPILRARALVVAGPRRQARGVLSVRNPSPRPLRIRIRGLANTRDLDDELYLAVTADGRSLFTGTQGELRRWSRRSLLLPAGARRVLTVVSWVGRPPKRSAASSIVDVSLEMRAFRSEPCAAPPSSPLTQPQPWVDHPPLPTCHELT